ncbi:MAG: endonuclease/exonuclease/phosphatase family protein [Anaerolineae bacterium]
MSQTIRFAWWNLENLFGPTTSPIEGWNQTRYDRKLEHLGWVIRHMHDGQGPDLLGVCEVETEGILHHLVDRHLSDLGYAIVHHDSPDLRGIDVAFLYRDSVFELDEEKTRAHTIMKRIPTRDIFEIQLIARANGSRLVVLGNHWPARTGGQYETEPFRILTAEHCSVIVQEHLTEDEDAQMLLLGDFNDEPFDRAIREYLLAIRDRDRVVDRRTRRPYVYNCMWPLLDGDDPGTFYYTANPTAWNMIDQVMVSPGLLRTGGLRLEEGSVAIFRPPEIQEAGKPKPFRKRGSRWIEGYSDHFPLVGLLEATEIRLRRRRPREMMPPRRTGGW